MAEPLEPVPYRPPSKPARPRTTPGGYTAASVDALNLAPDDDQLELAAHLIGRQVEYTDSKRYHHELLSAAVSPDSTKIAYVESRSRQRTFSSWLDITIKLHLTEFGKRSNSVDIASYNPYFGCTVSYFRWIGDVAILVYDEKHDTYVTRIGDTWPPRFVKIDCNWLITDSAITYLEYNEKVVRRLSFPDLAEMDAITIAEAERLKCCPRGPYAG
jgi:hypothetical protein